MLLLTSSYFIEAIPLQAWIGPEGYRGVEVPRFQDSRHTKVVRLSVLSTGRIYPPQEIFLVLISVGTAVAQWLRCCATNREVVGSIPAGVIGIFY